jgi:hypothetical protein
MISELIEELKGVAEIEQENVRLKAELAEAKEKYKAAREALADMQNVRANYHGAIRRFEHENHVLYHKLSNVLDFKRTDGYVLGRYDSMNRKELQILLDNVAPVDIKFPDGKPYTLEEYGTLAGMGMDYVSTYPEMPIVFC